MLPAIRMWRELGTAARLTLFWAAIASLLTGWGLVAQPRPPTYFPDPDGIVAVPDERGPVLSLWVYWDGARAPDGWLVLEAGAPRPPSAELFWRRRVHAGWNYLTWAEVGSLPAAAPLTLRVLDGVPAAWAVSTPRSADGYGLRDLAALRGLLVAAALAAVIPLLWLARGVGALPSCLGPLRRLGGWCAALAAVTVLALWLRLHTLSAQSLWFDEVLTKIGAQSFAWILYTPQIFGHPPVQYLAGWLAGGPDADEAWFRAPFVLAGAATVIALGWLGRVLLGRATGLIAALALALSPLHVELSQTARPYAFLLLFTALSLLALVEALRRDQWHRWLLFSALAALNLYTHYLALGVVLLEGALALAVLSGSRWRGGGSAAVSFGAVGLLLLPWATVLGRVLAARPSDGDPPTFALRQLVLDVFVPQFLGPGIPNVIALGVMALALTVLFRRRHPAVALGLWLVVPPVALWAAQPAHFVTGRHLAFVLPVALLLFAHGVTVVARGLGPILGWVGDRRPAAAPRAVAPVAALGLLLAWTVPTAAALREYYGSRLGFDWRVVASLLDVLVPEDRDVLATAGAAYPLRYYWHPRIEVLDPLRLSAQLEAPRAGPLWVVVHDGWDRPDGIDDWLRRHGVKVGQVPPSWSLPGVRIYRVSESASRSPSTLSPAG